MKNIIVLAIGIAALAMVAKYFKINSFEDVKNLVPENIKNMVPGFKEMVSNN